MGIEAETCDDERVGDRPSANLGDKVTAHLRRSAEGTRPGVTGSVDCKAVRLERKCARHCSGRQVRAGNVGRVQCARNTGGFRTHEYLSNG